MLSYFAEFILEMFVFLQLFLLSLLFSLFIFVFISGQNFVSSSKDTAATTAAIELIIRTIILLFNLHWRLYITHGN